MQKRKVWIWAISLVNVILMTFPPVYLSVNYFSPEMTLLYFFGVSIFMVLSLTVIYFLDKTKENQSKGG